MQSRKANTYPVVLKDLSDRLGEEAEILFDGSGRPGGQPVKRGMGALVVQADDVQGFAHALEILLTDKDLRKETGENAYRITVPYFTWPDRVPAFLDQIGTSPGKPREHRYEPAD